jgi:hypothetical protein
VFSFVTVRIPPPAIEFFVGICFGMTKALSRRYQQTVREAASGGCPQAFEESGIEVQLLTPFKADARPDEFSRLQVRCYGRKVLGLRRSKVSDVSIVAFEEGDWDDVLESELPPVPFE